MKQYDRTDKNDKVRRILDRMELVRRIEDDEEENEERASLQAKSSLEIGAPDDPQEKEADEVAKKVVNGSDAKMELNSSAPAVQRKQEKNGDTLMAKSENGSLRGTEQLQAKLDSSKGSGSPLNDAVKSEMGEKMGADLGDVKIHTDSKAHDMSEGINAKAFTHGQDIYFGQGNFDTDSNQGKELLAHELTHTVQQQNGVNRKVQRSMKFEFQTGNKIYAIDKKNGKTDAVLLPRKFGETSTSFKEDPKNEAGGNQPSYLATGKHGGAARPEGNYFIEPQAPTKMAEDTSADLSQKAQFELTYLIKMLPSPIDGAKVVSSNMQLIGEVNNALDPTVMKLYNPNTFLYKYVDINNNPLDIHIDEDNTFRSGPGKYMHVEKKEKWTETKQDKTTVTIDVTKPAEKSQEFQFKVQVKEKEIIGTPYVKNQLTEAKEKNYAAENKLKPGEYNAGMYEFFYRNLDGSSLDIHVDERDMTFQKGHVPLMRKKFLAATEQTAIELQAEHGGYVEFETPKWYRDWDDLKMRINDAVTMTSEISAPAQKVSDTDIIAAVTEAGDGPFEVYSWPYDTTSLSFLNSTGKKLYVKVVDPTWSAKVQASESITLSEYESTLEQHTRTSQEDSYNYYYSFYYAQFLRLNPGDYTGADVYAKDKTQKFIDSTVKSTVERVSIPAHKIFEDAYNKPTLKNKPTNAAQATLYKTHFQDLLGFLELILNYIYQAQTAEMYNSEDNNASYSKSAFDLMARTSFGSMYTQLLNDEEKLLFSEIVNNPGNPILSEIQTAIDSARGETQRARASEKKEKEAERDKLDPVKDATKIAEINSQLQNWRYWNLTRWDLQPLTRKSTLFFDKVGTKAASATLGPVIYEWLTGMITGIDRLTAANYSGLSASHGIRKVSSDTKDKDYKQAQFEVRIGPSIPASDWVSYAQGVFTTARLRGGDIPDDLATGKNESAKTGLKK